MDLNSLEVKIEDNEFDSYCEETVEQKIDDDQEMKTVVDEKENDECAEGSKNLEGTSKINHEDLRLKINKSKESHDGRKNDGRRNAEDRHSRGITTRRPGLVLEFLLNLHIRPCRKFVVQFLHMFSHYETEA